MKLHIVRAQKFGHNEGYDDIAFPADAYTPETALAQFKPVIKAAFQNNHWYAHKAYGFDGETYYSIRYSGLADGEETRKSKESNHEL